MGQGHASFGRRVPGLARQLTEVPAIRGIRYRAVGEQAHEEKNERERTSWSEADRRMLMITIGGGLAANVGAVLLVGSAIAFTRWYKSHGHLSSGLLVIPSAIALLSVASLLWSPTPFDPRRTWRSLIALGLLVFCTLESLLIVVGLASGIK